jgi:hypothetical protein
MAKTLDLIDTKDELKRLAANQDNKVPYNLFFWVISGVGALISVGIIIISGILFYAFGRIDNIESKSRLEISSMNTQYKLDIHNIEIKHQVDHDKIIKLETIIETLEK